MSDEVREAKEATVNENQKLLTKIKKNRSRNQLQK